jgi:serine kinase of HPr protein (carbohydrate metabolism regulator)
MLINATCVAIDDKGVLLSGPPGAGKSDLALRLIDQGAKLIADDQTEIEGTKDGLIAAPPPSITGLFEIRHLGLVRMPYLSSVRIALYVELALLHEKLPRLPEAEKMFLLDQAIPRLRLPAFAASTPAKIRAALAFPLATDAE